MRNRNGLNAESLAKFPIQYHPASTRLPIYRRQTTQKTYFPAEIKTVASTMYKAYIRPADNREQLNAMIAYSSRNTQTRTAMFIVLRNDMRSNIKEKVEYRIMKRLIGFRSLTKGVVPIIVNVF